jgi:hypothetical protein
MSVEYFVPEEEEEDLMALQQIEEEGGAGRESHRDS